MKKTFEIPISYVCFLDTESENRDLLSILECIDEVTEKLCKERKNVHYTYFPLKDITKLNQLNKQIELYLKKRDIPSTFLFTLKHFDNINEIGYIQEIFSGQVFLCDASLLEYCRISKIKAHYKMLNYSLQEINATKNIMKTIIFSKETQQEKTSLAKIIPFSTLTKKNDSKN